MTQASRSRSDALIVVRREVALRSWCIVATMCVALLLNGCAPETTTPSSQRSPLIGVPHAMTDQGGVSATPFEGKVAHRAGENQTLKVRTAVLLLGSVPYDNLSLPLTSPDGKYLVTETGVPPTWETLRAEGRAEPPLETQLRIFLLDYTGSGNTGRLATVEDSVLLGRACTDQGFLVEAPRTDGSRWIGLCNWKTGEITWIVQGSSVNAFATINEFGDLAWCRRLSSGGNLELVVKPFGGEEIKVGAYGEDWLMPVWGQQRGRLFAMRLVEGKLTATYLDTTNAATLSKPLYELELAINASVDTAYQCMDPFPSIAGVPRPQIDQLLFFHPVRLCTAVWTPMEQSNRQLVLIPGDSISAWLDRSRYAMVTTRKALVRQNILSTTEQMELLRGLLIPRPTTSTEWPYVLLAPARPGQIGLSALNLLPTAPEELP